MSEEKPINYAGFWIRFVAFIIDSLVMNFFTALIILPILGIIGFSTITLAELSDMDEAEILATVLAISTPLYLANAVMYWLYYAGMHASRWQATLGKRAVGIQVVDRNYERGSFTTTSLRYLGKIISSMTMLIGYIIAGFTDKKQALHDFIASTYVVYKD